MLVKWLDRLARRIAPFSQRTTVIRRRFHTPRRFERLETRVVFATDLQVASFGASGGNLIVNYHVANQDATPFDIAIYESTDGVSLGNRLQTSRVTDASQLARGQSHQAIIAADFQDPSHDYFLVVVLDAGSELGEASEANNASVFAGGVFQTVSGVIHVHGDADANELNIATGSSLQISLDAGAYYFASSQVTGVRVRLHGGADEQFVQSGVTQPIQAWGGAGNDVLYGSDAGDDLVGGEGDDQLFGGAGNDWLYGDQGQTWGSSITEGGADILHGEFGDDWLFGEGGNDLVYGGADTDFAYGGYGSDHVHSGSGQLSQTEWLFGDAGDDDLYLENAFADQYDYDGSNTVHLTSGETYSHNSSTATLTINGSTSNPTLSLATVFNGWSYSLQLNGRTIADVYAVSHLLVEGSTGNDTIDLSGLSYGSISLSSVLIKGGAGDDTIFGSFANDVIEGGEGNDSLYGYGGSDTISGGSGADLLHGGDGNDSLSGGTQNDSLIGGAGSDYLYGQEDNDYLDGGADSDWIEGGAGNDTLYGDANESYGGYGGYGSPDTMYGGAGDDLLYGGAAADYLYGGEGDDAIIGGDGNDYVSGGTGNDTFDQSYGDNITDQPMILNFTVTYLGDDEWHLRGKVVDDEDPTGRQIGFGGALSAFCVVGEDDWFNLMVGHPANIGGWVSADFVDAEGLSAETVWDSFS